MRTILFRPLKMVLFFVCVLFVFSSCSNSTKEGDGNFFHYTDFPESVDLQGIAVNADAPPMRYAYRVTLHDSFAIVMDLHSVEQFFHLFSYPDWQHLTSFGQRGEGPKELITASSVRFLSTDSIWTLDANRKQIIRWSINPATATTNLSMQEVNRVTLSNEIGTPLEFSVYDDSTLLIPDFLGRCRYYSLSMNGTIRTSHDSIPVKHTADEHSSPAALASAWRSFTDYNHATNTYVMATQLGEVLSIYNYKNDTTIVCYGPNGAPRYKEQQGMGFPDGIMGFGDIQITSKHIYASFSGVSIKENMKAAQSGREVEDGGRWIYQFDHKGRPLRRFHLDHPIYGFRVDEQRGIIIGLCPESDHPILQFPLNKDV